MFQMFLRCRYTVMNKTKMSHLSNSLHLHISVYEWRLEEGEGDKYIGKYERKIPDSDNSWAEK